jgi:ribosomal protein S18 acetylase RimI-like enzyme
MITFKPINLDIHKDLCIKFREDSFVVSFGNADRFYETDGKGADRYIKFLMAKIEKDPATAVHVYEDNQIIGQMELGRLRNDQTTGYVNLYYLIPEKRGKGLGLQLDQYAMNYFKNIGLRKVRLSVSPTNNQALSYYKKMGWIDLGPRPEHPEVNFMEKDIR